MSTTNGSPLNLYEEIMLLALRDEQGTIAAGFPEHLVAGAILAELLFKGRISVEETRKQLVDLKDKTPTGDPIINESLDKIATARRRASLQTWVSRLAGLKDLRHRIARQLCDRGILRADEDKILFLFTRKIYPETNPAPEQEIVGRLRDAIFSDDEQIAPRTAVLLSLANGANLLGGIFGRKEIKSRKKRVEQIANGELTAKATQEAVAACQAAIIVAAVLVPMMTTSVVINSN